MWISWKLFCNKNTQKYVTTLVSTRLVANYSTRYSKHLFFDPISSYMVKMACISHCKTKWYLVFYDFGKLEIMIHWELNWFWCGKFWEFIFVRTKYWSTCSDDWVISREWVMRMFPWANHDQQICPLFSISWVSLSFSVVSSSFPRCLPDFMVLRPIYRGRKHRNVSITC